MKNRLVDNKYDGCTGPKVKANVVKSFGDPNGSLRVVVATIAFGMGMDCQNIRHVIHWGPPDDIDMYVQESGRGGRDGKECQATLYYSSSEIGCKHVSEEMSDYCEGKTSRRDVLMGVFLDESCKDIEKPRPQHTCCDICSHTCPCDGCASQPLPEPLPEPLPSRDLVPECIVPYPIDLEHKLLDYRSQIYKLQHPTASYFLGYQLSVGLTDDVIKMICSNYMNIESPFTLLDMGVAYPHHADCLFEIIDKHKKQ